MERVRNDGKWSLFCPSDASGLADSWGIEFENLYSQYEEEVNLTISPYALKAFFFSLTFFRCTQI